MSDFICFSTVKLSELLARIVVTLLLAAGITLTRPSCVVVDVVAVVVNVEHSVIESGCLVGESMVGLVMWKRGLWGLLPATVSAMRAIVMVRVVGEWEGGDVCSYLEVGWIEVE